MGAKQSKRSVDISGKEGDAAGEVAAAGAGGEGRVEQLADADALKPQLNGDAHIHQPTDKEKELDSGTPENEKDATTEKESKEQDEEKEKDTTPITNGEGEQKTENGDSAPTPDDAKKPKKEKVKKKWSLRSISFSRKDKPKQEKKQKEEEPKTNGEPDKVPEETAESSPEPVVNEETEQSQMPVDAKDEKAPDTPVTEPITNGSSTPESPKLEIPPAEETVAVTPEEVKAEIKTETEPELPVNGLSIEETKQDIPEIENKIEEIIASKPAETPVETTEVVPVPEIPVKKEVCVEQVPLIEPTPPPLPANPPPSSVASFAATTMAPELTDASLSNTTETSAPAQPSATESNTSFNDNTPEPQTNLTNATSVTDVLTSPLNETDEDKIITNSETDILENKVESENECKEEPAPEINLNEASVAKVEECHIEPDHSDNSEKSITASENIVDKLADESAAINVGQDLTETLEPEPEINKEVCEIQSESKVTENSTEVVSTIEQNEINDNREDSPTTLNLSESVKEAENEDTAEVISTVADEINKEGSEIEEEIQVTPETNTNIEPLVVTEPVDVVEFPPPPPDVHDAVDKRDEVMDESNDTDGQEPVDSTIVVDCNDTKTNIVADLKVNDTENIEVIDKVVEEDNINTCKDPLGNVIENLERNGNLDNMDVAQENISAPTEDAILPNPGDVMTSDPEAEKEVVASDDSMSVTKESVLAEAGEGAAQAAAPCRTPAAPHTPTTPQDPLPEKVSDKMAELITEISPVPELKTDMETSSDVAVAN